jgi:hypothetical protein
VKMEAVTMREMGELESFCLEYQVRQCMHALVRAGFSRFSRRVEKDRDPFCPTRRSICTPRAIMDRLSTGRR